MSSSMLSRRTLESRFEAIQRLRGDHGMVIIDAHNHVGGPDKSDGAKQSPEEIIAKMNQTGIDKAVIFPFNEINPGISFSLANNYIAAAVKKYPSRLIGFARLDPNYEEKALLELERAVNKLGLRGVKLHPSSQNFSLDDPIVLGIIEKAAELKIPIIFDSGKPLSPPRKIGVLAERAPDATIIMAHMQGPMYLEVAEEFNNIYLGTTGMFNLAKIQEALLRLGAAKLIAGSDSPYIQQRREIKKFDLTPGIRKEDKALVLGENMKEILGL